MSGGRTEAAVTKSISRYLKGLGSACWFVKKHGSGWGRNGVPDLLVCYRGRFLGLELKREVGGAATKLQLHEVGKIKAAGGVAEAEVRSVAEVHRLIEAIDAELGDLPESVSSAGARRRQARLCAGSAGAVRMRP